MALTPEDVVNKRFNPTKFREGYDQDEVDDFLDEVVVELRRLNQENEELRQRLVAADGRINELQRAGAQAAAVAAPAPAPVAAPEPVFAPAAVEAQPAEADPGNTNNLLQLARRLHEEHVREGMEKRDALIAEGHAAAARVVSEAEQVGVAKIAEAEQASAAKVAEAEQAAQQAGIAKAAELEQTARAQLSGLEQERASLQRDVEELQAFEREYRTKLKGYIEGQLRELESSNALTAGSAPQAAVAAPAAAPEAAPAQAAAAPDQAEQYAVAAPQPAAAAAPAYNGPQSSDFSAYPQPTEYPGFAGGN
ncbi:hypothetical protein BH11ACT3_BH11ACT3_17760 [soil metagenome]